MSQIYNTSPFMNELQLNQMNNVQVPFQPGMQPNVQNEVQKGVEAALKNQGKNFSVPYKNPDMPMAEPEAVKNQMVAYLDKQIEEKQAQIALIGEKIQELRQAATGIQSKYAPKQENLDELERKIAANRARRIKKDNESTEMWRWKREQDEKKRIADMQYNWQKEQNGIEDSLAQMTARNEFNGSLNSALSQWQAAKKSGDAIAEAYAKQNVDQLVAYGKAKFGIDFEGKIKQAEELAAKNNETEAQKKAEEEAHIQHIAGIENEIMYATTDPDRLALQKKIKEDKELSESEKRDLLMNDNLVTRKRRTQKAADDATVANTGKRVSENLDEANNKKKAREYVGKEMNTLAFTKLPEEVTKYLAIDATGKVIMKEGK